LGVRRPDGVRPRLRQALKTAPPLSLPPIQHPAPRTRGGRVFQFWCTASARRPARRAEPGRVDAERTDGAVEVLSRAPEAPRGLGDVPLRATEGGLDLFGAEGDRGAALGCGGRRLARP